MIYSTESSTDLYDYDDELSTVVWASISDDTDLWPFPGTSYRMGIASAKEWRIHMDRLADARAAFMWRGRRPQAKCPAVWFRRIPYMRPGAWEARNKKEKP